MPVLIEAERLLRFRPIHGFAAALILTLSPSETEGPLHGMQSARQPSPPPVEQSVAAVSNSAIHKRGVPTSWQIRRACLTILRYTRLVLCHEASFADLLPKPNI